MSYPSKQHSQTGTDKDGQAKGFCAETNSRQNLIQEIFRTKFNEGRWTQQQCALFCKYYGKIGKDWKEIAKFIPSRTAEQVRSHAQKFLSRKQRKEAEQQEMNQAQKLLEKGPNQRSTRARKNRQCFNEQQLSARAPKPTSAKKTKTEKQIKDPVPKESEQKERSSSKSIELEIVQEKQKNECMTYGEEKLYCQTQPIIHLPQPNIVHCFSGIHAPSYLWEKLLSYLNLGIPIPIFIFGLQHSTDYTPIEENKEKSKSMIEIYNRSTELNGKEDENATRGFVRFRKNNENINDDNFNLVNSNCKSEKFLGKTKAQLEESQFNSLSSRHNLTKQERSKKQIFKSKSSLWFQ